MGLLNLARAAAPYVRRIVVIGPTPEMRDDVTKCIEAGLDCDASRADFEAAATTARAVMADLAKLPKVEVVDPVDWLCNKTTCPATRDGEPLYWDMHHVTRPMAAKFAASYLGTRQSVE